MASFKQKYETEVVPEMMKTLGITNKMRVPKLIKIVLNMGIGVKEKDMVKKVIQDLTAISGQKPVVTRARKSISNFKVRAGMDIGAKVTLRGVRMYEFMERLVSAALPRIRDFRGAPRKGFDGRGNYTLGLSEQTIFPEIDPNASPYTQGMDITFVTTAEKDAEALELLKMMGMPFAAK